MKKMFAAVLFVSLLTTAAFAHQFSGRLLTPTVVPKLSSFAAVGNLTTPTLVADGPGLPPVKQSGGGGGGQAAGGSFTATPSLVADGPGLPPVKQSGGGGGGQAV